jgi:transposase
MKRIELSFKQTVVNAVIRRKLKRKEAYELLSCTPRTLTNYINKVTESGLEDLKDKRQSNNSKLTPKQLLDILEKKKEKPFRSARKVLEITNIQNISTRRVQQIWMEHNLNKLNVERLKPITRFVSDYPNDLWQADIMGRIRFPYLGDAYLIANIDDCSRFILGAKFFSNQTQMNVFRVWYHCLFQWGLPKKMLQDKGSQYKSNTKYGQTGEYVQSTYQFYARSLGIDLIFAHKARTKGKIEKFWRFVQQDFARENLDVKSFGELNKRFFKWQIKFNEEFKHSGIGMNGRIPAEVYQPSERTKPKQELSELLTITVRRFVYLDSTISLFGKRYKVPSGYIKCRIWLKIKGEKASLEAMGKTILRFRLKA